MQQCYNSTVNYGLTTTERPHGTHTRSFIDSQSADD